MTPQILPKILIIGYIWPETNASAAGVRDWAFFKQFRESGWEVAYTSPAKENEFTEKIRAEGGIARSFPANDPAFDAFLLEFRPDFVLFDRFVTEEQFGWRVFETLPEAVRIVDTQDLHFLRRARESAIKAGKSVADVAELSFPLESEDLLRELGSIYRSDISLVISSFEMKLLQERFQAPRSLLEHIPFSYIPSPSDGPRFEDRGHFAVIGNFRHPPNWDGVLWLKNEIWPQMKKLQPSARVDVYGAYPSREAMALSAPQDGFHVIGPVSDSVQTLSGYRVNLAPLRFGAGIKGKIADGWMAGTPVVTTSIGAEGMENTDGQFGGEITNTAEDFARRAIDLSQNFDRWKRLQAIGRHTLESQFNWEKSAEKLISRLMALKENLPQERARNLFGSILWRHSNRSTKYFSKWIELKNSR